MKEITKYEPLWPESCRDFVRRITLKYGQGWPRVLPPNLALSDEEVRECVEILFDDQRNVGRTIHEADKQIGSTKGLLNLPQASGLMIMINHGMELSIPSILSIRNKTALLRRKPDKSGYLYEHIDAILVLGRTEGYTSENNTRFDLIEQRFPNTTHPAFLLAYNIAAELRKNASNVFGGDVRAWKIRLTRPNAPLNALYRMSTQNLEKSLL